VKLYFAGGEGLPRPRQKQMFTDGVRYRLVSFFTGTGPTIKVVQCALEWEKEQEEKSDETSSLEDSPQS
jgi:hypothetical protein